MERVRNATHLRKLVAGREVRYEWSFGAYRSAYSVKVNTAEAESLRRQAETFGHVLIARVPTDGAGREYLYLSLTYEVGRPEVRPTPGLAAGV